MADDLAQIFLEKSKAGQNIIQFLPGSEPDFYGFPQFTVKRLLGISLE
ncbi:Uncharacterised protein [Mycobacteroides abscessus subsp. abscessus]|nr:Uncharacterised protein [Mycobacteroides abscessus subsp. abscessus]